MTDEQKLIDDGSEMPLMGHLQEFRNRLVRAIVFIAVGFSVAYFFANEIFNILKLPLLKALPLGTTEKQALHFTSPMDVLMTQLKVAFLVGVVTTSPFWIREFWKFFEPALYPKERKLIFPFVFLSILFFNLGLIFGYYAMLPMAMSYLIGIGMEVGTPLITVTEYSSFLVVMLLGAGLIFETPLVLVLLNVLGLLERSTLVEYRRFVIVVILIVAAILTPPDPVSQILMAVPMYVMFELSLLVMKYLEKKQS